MVSTKALPLCENVSKAMGEALQGLLHYRTQQEEYKEDTSHRALGR